MSENPHPNGHKKLIGGDIAFRIRIGNYRVIYNVYENELVIEVIRIGHRKNVYPWNSFFIQLAGYSFFPLIEGVNKTEQNCEESEMKKARYVDKFQMSYEAL